MITRRIGRTQRVKIGGIPATYHYRHRKPGQGAGRVMAGIPQPEGNLLVWLDGATFGNQRIDAYTALGTYNFDMSGAHCASLDGVGKLGETATRLVTGDTIDVELEISTVDTANSGMLCGQHFRDWEVQLRLDIDKIYVYFGDGSSLTAVSFPLASANIVDGRSHTLKFKIEKSVGDVTFTLDNGTPSTISGTPRTGNSTDVFAIGRRSGGGEYFEGQIYNVTVDNYHFRIAEGSGLTSFSDDYLTDGYSITWTASAATLWTQGQNSYFGNVGGWWEINGDPVMYPYPVAGFDTYHKAGTFNGCETSYSPVSPVPPEIIAQDLLEGRFFTDISDNPVPRDQSEIEAFVVGKGASFFCEERGLKLYNEILTGQDLVDAQGDCA